MAEEMEMNSSNLCLGNGLIGLRSLLSHVITHFVEPTWLSGTNQRTRQGPCPSAKVLVGQQAIHK